jgi:hypothetical protein
MARNALAAATIEDGEIKLVMIQTAHSTVNIMFSWLLGSGRAE